MTSAHDLHLGVAEAGKASAVKGDHKEALRHYREALKLAVSSKAPEVFFRHYTQCVLESLELTDAFPDVIEFCESADAHYRETGTPTEFHRKDHGSILERLGVVLLKAGETDRAKEMLATAIATAGKAQVPLAEQLHGWLSRGMMADKRRIGEAQAKFGYFTVRPDQVDERRARPLPPVDANEKAAAPLGL